MTDWRTVQKCARHDLRDAKLYNDLMFALESLGCPGPRTCDDSLRQLNWFLPGSANSYHAFISARVDVYYGAVTYKLEGVNAAGVASELWKLTSTGGDLVSADKFVEALEVMTLPAGETIKISGMVRSLD